MGMLSPAAFIRALLLAPLLLMLNSLALRQLSAVEPQAQEILAMVRRSYAARNEVMNATLRDNQSGRSEPLQLTLNADGMVLQFSTPPKERLVLELNEGQALLWEEQDGRRKAISREQAAQPLRDMALNREDLSLRFTHWKESRVIDPDVKLGAARVACWLVRCVAPNRDGPYGTVDLWVEKQSGGIAKMQAHDVLGKLVKRFQVTKLQRIGELSMVREMRIEAIDAASGKTTGRTYLTLEPVKS
jgi:hypothetical protein